MLETISSSFWVIVVAMLWGCTNPLIKKFSSGVTDLPKDDSKIKNFLRELWFLYSNWKYTLSFLLNMSGSVVFYWSLGHVKLSLLVPITNSLTFLFTTVTSTLLGEHTLSKRKILFCLLKF